MALPVADAPPGAGLIWAHRRGAFDLAREGVVMGILNVTPDSFSDGGDFMEPAAAIERGLALEADGAAIVDVGGESTRPGAEPVPEAEEMRRVLPVIAGLRERSAVVISVDTAKAAVAAEALAAGADIVNDVSGFGSDPRMAGVVAASGAGAVLMHMRGRPADMQRAPVYDDVVEDVREFLRQALDLAVSSGMPLEKLAIDPGIGFGKTAGHNLELVRATDRLAALGRPVLLGVSRKSFLAALGDAPDLADRHWPGVAVTVFGRLRGARIFRVHDPRPHLEALRMAEAIAAHA